MSAPESLAVRIAVAPPLASPPAEADLEALAGRADDLAALLADHPPARDLLVAAFAASPYLRGLCEADPSRLVRVLEADPDAHLSWLTGAAAGAVPVATSEAEAMRLLRRLKGEAALLVALADLGGVWALEQVTGALAEVADVATSAAVRFLLTRAAGEGKLKPAFPDVAEGCGYTVLAMGKHGARELNYSSDIDLIVLHESAAAPLRPGVEPASFFVRLTKALVKLLQERTGDGYVFRVDLRLRPDPGSTAVSIDLDAALHYYESMGQNWERAALIKSRPVAGDLALGETVLRHLQPFVFRKYFDFAAVADVHAMKRQIHTHKGHGAVAVEGHDIKLGRGGIREIEFFVQTQQLIAGGRDARLRGRETLRQLALLAETGWTTEEARDELGSAYRFLRALEHRLQMVADEQTHALPRDPAAVDRIARLMGFQGRDPFAAALSAHLGRVEHHYARLFENAPALAASAGSLVFTGTGDDPDTLETLAAMGFAEPARVTETVRAWHFGRYAATRSERAREQLTELVPVLLEALGRSDNPDTAFLAFDRFMARLPAGVQLFALLRSNPALLRLLTEVLGLSPMLAESVIRRPHALDALLEPDFFGRLPTEEELSARLAAVLAEARSYEDALDRARVFADEQRLLIGVRVLSRAIPPLAAGPAYAALADALIGALHRLVADELARTHGRVPGAASAILALGRLGAREMTATSDLDLIVLYDHPEGAVSDGAKPLAPSQYFARFTQRLVAALTAPTAEGRLYEVDLRLRPSGRAGPLATSLTSFEAYQRGEAWVWEHMALSRARVVSVEGTVTERASAAPASSAGDLGARAIAVIRDVLTLPRDAAHVFSQVAEMRGRVAQEKGHAGPWDLKLAPGGLLDLEFLAQALQLAHGATHPEILSPNTEAALAACAPLLSAEEAEDVLAACRLQQALMQVTRLCVAGPLDTAHTPRALASLLAATADLPDLARLEAELREQQAKVRSIFEVRVGARP